ncbi:MAG: response regulator, partial [Candidatus Neomarinimicrobiota bacterium]
MNETQVTLPLSGDADNLSVLIHDPDANYRKILRGMLKQEREIAFKVREITNKKIDKALEKAIPDVVVLGMDLQQSDAMDNLQQVREIDVSPVVILAAGGNEQSAVAAMKKGAYDYIPKTYLTLDQLTKALINAREKWRLLK